MKILMVCLGNICRSPLAEGILQSKLPAGFTVESAGTIDFHQGQQPDERSISTAKKYGIDISQQRSKHLVADDLDRYDRIYCMDKNNLKDVLSLAKSDDQRSKVSLMIKNKEVPDPYYGDLNDFDNVFKMLDDACQQVADELIENVPAHQSSK